MENSKLLRIALWANVAFAEIGALIAVFLSGKWMVIDEITNGQALLVGIELLILAGLSAYAALKKKIIKPLIWLVVALNVLLAVFLVSRLTDAAISAVAMEILLLDILTIITITFFLVKGIRTYRQELKPTLSA